MMNPIPKISVIIPCFNNETTILETIESVNQQEYSSIEMVIVNDGSTDRSTQVISDYIKNNNAANITLINQVNSGPSKSRNNGADKAIGKYLLFLDADDIIAPSFINKCIEHLEKDQTLNIVYTEAEYFGAKNRAWILPEFKISNFLESNCIPISAVIRNEVFKEVGKFDENLNYTEDWELWIRIVKEFGGVHKIPESLFFYRKRFDKSSITDDKKNWNIRDQSTLYIYNKHYAYFSENNYDIETLLKSKDSNGKYKKKYYNVWYRKLFYKITKK
ncbi:glycosyltransferase family 2 protein [Flavobacterium sp. ZB4P13]|uniref:glycosyltransferase family 2 protein n=1 Tax=Flavobacterium sp. ZB4P13 TaxID=3401728 RepID=UPI003AAD6492